MGRSEVMECDTKLPKGRENERSGHSFISKRLLEVKRNNLHCNTAQGKKRELLKKII